MDRYVRSIATKEQIMPDLTPVIIYYRKASMTSDQYACMGNLFTRPGYQKQVVTSEHLLRKEVVEPQSFSVRYLTDTFDAPPRFYLGQIHETSKTVNLNADVLIMGITNQPVMHTGFSDFTDGEVTRHLYGEPVMANVRIPRLRSLLTGEWVTAFGWAVAGVETNSPRHMMIDFHGQTGMSGSGFTDDYGGLWILHGGPDAEGVEQIKEDCFRQTKMVIKHISSVSGPLTGNYPK